MELKKVAQDLGEDMTDEELQAAFSKADLDEDGFVTAEDFYNIMTHRVYWDKWMIDHIRFIIEINIEHQLNITLTYWSMFLVLIIYYQSKHNEKSRPTIFVLLSLNSDWIFHASVRRDPLPRGKSLLYRYPSPGSILPQEAPRDYRTPFTDTPYDIRRNTMTHYQTR